MTDFNFSKTHKQAEKDYNLGAGEYFKIKEGLNTIRLVSVCLPHNSTYQGRPTFKWLCQVIDRVDGELKPYFMPDIIYKSIEALQLGSRFSFKGVPMPYDLEISAKNAGVKSVVYNVMPGEESPISEAELKAIEDAPTVQELQQRVRENEENREEDKQPGETTETIPTIQQDEGVVIDEKEIPPFEDEQI